MLRAPMTSQLVVQKFGGSSVGDADRIRRVAQRIARARVTGADLVVVVSAMGDTTDELLQLAAAITPDPNPRELSEPELAYELERLTIDLEERSLDERADYIASALAEAEQSADRESIDQLLRESQLMNEKRKSLHRRRDQTRLLSRPQPVRA